ncbi:glycosyltransferase [Enterobacteriaceae bacterium RIT714]|nr:glycosyltransferase [Enterobacteriaceae bacterium RIT714]
MDSLSVFYTGMFRFPDKDAAGKRVLNIAKTIEKFNDCENIIIGGWEQGTTKETSLTRKISHLSFSLLDKKRDSKFKKLFGFLFMGITIIPWMFRKRDRFTHIVLYNTPFVFTVACVILSYLFNKKLVLDSTEWYESEHIIGGSYGPASIENWFRMHLAYPLVRNVIAISSFLEHYYQQKKIHVIKVPPLADENNTIRSSNKTGDYDVTFMYAGSPGKKDRLDLFIYDLLSNKEIDISIRFYIAGITKDDFLEQYPACNINNNILDTICVFLGRLKMSEVIDYYKKIDYCVFFREQKRYALAGFPSKYVEALSHGVPVITNGVGDIVDDFPETGILFQPGKDNINQLIENAFDNKIRFRHSIANIFENKYSTKANVERLHMFFRQAK